MKKVLAFMAVAASILVVSCKKPNNGGNNNGGGNNDEPEYVAPIKIDGDFSDWAKLDASKVAKAECPADATKTALKKMQVYADALFVYVYIEYDKDQISHEPDVEHVPMHVYINGDGLATTGGFGDQWNDACMDVMMEGFIYPDGAAIGSYEPGIYKWVGETNGTGWEGCWEELGDIAGITAGAGIEGKYEFSIVRELYPIGKLADTFSIGIDIQQSWDSVGFLPIGTVDDDNTSGHANSLTVTTAK